MPRPLLAASEWTNNDEMGPSLYISIVVEQCLLVRRTESYWVSVVSTRRSVGGDTQLTVDERLVRLLLRMLLLVPVMKLMAVMM